MSNAIASSAMRRLAECDESGTVDEPIVTDPLYSVSLLLELISDHFSSGTAGPDAAAEIGIHETRPVDVGTLLTELAGSDLSNGARMARMVDAAVANLSLVVSR